MSSEQIVNWLLWGFGLAAGVGGILGLIKLRLSEKFLPQWTELSTLDGTLAFRREEFRQVTEGIEKCRTEIGQLEATVGHLRILKEWYDANPEASARIQQMMVDLERCKSELAAVQSKLAQDEQRLNLIKQESDKLVVDNIRLEEERGGLREEVITLQKTKAELDKQVFDLQQVQRDLQNQVNDLLVKQNATDRELDETLEKLEVVKKEKRDAESNRDRAIADCNAAKAELLGLQKSLETYKALVENLNAQLKQASVGHTDIAKALEDLAQPTLKFNFSKGSSIDETTTLKRLAEHLGKKGLHYPERVQRFIPV